MTHGPDDHVTSGTMELTWYLESRLAVVRFTAETSLTGQHGTAMADALGHWIGASARAFALLADAQGVSGTDTEFRAATGGFFAPHRDSACLAIVRLRPAIRVIADMYREGVGLNLKTFEDETAGRAWLRAQGIGA